MAKTCDICGGTFIPGYKSGKQRRCSPECKAEGRRRSLARFRLTPKAKAIYQRHNFTAKRKAYVKKWRQTHTPPFVTSPEGRIAQSLRSRLGQAINGVKKQLPTMALVGCTVAELRVHLESQFKPGMSWANYGRVGWHIDHKRPLASFQFFNEDFTLNEAALRQSMHFTNLQPLWYWENVSKSDNLQAQ